MAMKDVTRREILLAMQEYDRLGQDDFLATYGFHRSLVYRVSHEGRLYDSKAIVGVAHRYLPDGEALRPDQLSGGHGHALDVLRREGFTVVGRTAPVLTVGALLDRLRRARPGRASGRPSLHQAVALAWAVGRAGRGEERLVAWSETEREVEGLLREHGVNGERPRADYPVAALARAGIWDLPGRRGEVPTAHGDGEVRRWFAERQPVSGLEEQVYETLRVSGAARVATVDLLVERYFPGTDPAGLLAAVGLWDESVADDAPDAPALPAVPEEDAAAEYRRLCALVERAEERDGRGRRTSRVGSDPIRSAAARRAVLTRCGGRCENPGCTGQPHDVSRAGEPLLEVDHVRDLAGGGRDHPEQMAALCPNCHAIKTRGSRGEELRAVLLAVAVERHLSASRAV
ncbi:HNH endonuclease [Streptomyces avicenniae]|uniref:HNH endonuclease n=1 Tax=Streptomyces avicenniae TaxID=500153 RepID=UPI00069B47E7|nr:HNH endonuclease signature motif containing protein [Streptomyces avicenniae]